MISRPRTRALVFATLLAIAPSAGVLQAVTLVYPQSANHIHFSICPALDGMNILVPDPVENIAEFFLLTSPSQEIQDELAGGDEDFSDWTFDYTGATLSGTFTIDIYKSRFRGTHWSGSEISIRYEKGAGDPDSLRWVQQVTTTDPIDPNGANPPGPPSSPYIDPYPDDDDGVEGPFYYSDEEDSTFDYRDRIDGETDAAGFGTDYDIRFYDFPSRTHAPTSFVKWQGELWLTAADTADKEVTFHDGIGYGFEAGCIDWHDLITYVIGTTVDMIVYYDTSTQTLNFSDAPVTVLNATGSLSGIDPEFVMDPLNGAQMTIAPFQHMPEAGLPMGLELFRGGAIQIYDPEGGDLLYQAEIPFLILSDQMHDQYNMTGVYHNILVEPTVPSFFLQQYEDAAGWCRPVLDSRPHAAVLRAERGADRYAADRWRGVNRLGVEFLRAAGPRLRTGTARGCDFGPVGEPRNARLVRPGPGRSGRPARQRRELRDVVGALHGEQHPPGSRAAHRLAPGEEPLVPGAGHSRLGQRDLRHAAAESSWPAGSRNCGVAERLSVNRGHRLRTGTRAWPPEVSCSSSVVLVSGESHSWRTCARTRAFGFASSLTGSRVISRCVSQESRQSACHRDQHARNQ